MRSATVCRRRLGPPSGAWGEIGGRSPRAARSEAFGTLTRNPGARIDVAMLRAGSFVLQLVAYAVGGGETLELEHRNVGNLHLSFWVADVRARFRELSDDPSVEVISELAEQQPAGGD